MLRVVPFLGFQIQLRTAPAVLPAPVGVVKIVAGKLVGFLIGRRIGGTLCGSTPDSEVERMLFVENFFQ